MYDSIIAGKKFATAVPLVQTKTVGTLFPLVTPNAKNAADRSSNWLKQDIFLFSTNANVSGEFLAPGDMHAYLTPKLDSVCDMIYDHLLFKIIYSCPSDNASRIGCNLSSVSSHSFWGIDSATIPPPTNTCASSSKINADLNAT